ncbi:MAG: N-acetyl-gamma-glutamyl-phosphate reductase [Planctomycetota bacterium]|nr:N-acetyl-gamma-glutamyl-phosphate reductase [Planctomycetota bacterium]
MSSQHEINAVVVGAAGYSGGELVGHLLSHPGVNVVGLFATDRRAGDDGHPSFGSLFPRWRGATDLAVESTSVEAILALEPDVVFLATPVEASLELAGALRDAGKAAPVVIDISAAFRLKQVDVFAKHYGLTHPREDLLERAVYGMCELNRKQIAGADLIACPGCYPTSAILPLAALTAAGAIDGSGRVIIDSTSGVSGAGRSASAKTHFCEVSLAPYAVLSHRHQPEIDAYCGAKTIFTPHLGAFDRGILSTIHAELNAGWTEKKVRAALEKQYGDEAFVRILPRGEWPSVAGVRGTNCCDIGFAVDEESGHLVLVSAIDNLVKGAAGQAVQCMNIRFSFPETAGLSPILS